MGETPYFWVFKVTENEMFTNIPFAKLEMSKKLIFVKIRFRPPLFLPETWLFLVRKILTWLLFFLKNYVFSRKSQNLLVANCKGNQFLFFGANYEFAPEKQHRDSDFASFFAYWPYPLRKTVRTIRTILYFIWTFSKTLTISPSQKWDNLGSVFHDLL